MVAPAAGLVLSPGASGSRDHPTLLSIRDTAKGAGLACLLHDFGTNSEGRRRQPRIASAVAELVDHLPLMAKKLDLAPEQLVVGGRSFGGRAWSMAVAEMCQDQAVLPVAGLALLSYPLHPPGKPDVLRTDHFQHLNVPCLFVSAANDPFMSPAELSHHAAAIDAPVELEVLPAGGHDPSSNATRAQIAERVVRWVTSLGS